MNNKRKSQRIHCAVPVDGKKDSVFAKTQTVDFSKGGIGLISSRKIPINKKIAVELDLEPQEDPVLAIGRVKWVRSIADSDNYRIGLIFSEVRRGSKTQLNQYFKNK